MNQVHLRSRRFLGSSNKNRSDMEHRESNRVWRRDLEGVAARAH